MSCVARGLPCSRHLLSEPSVYKLSYSSSNISFASSKDSIHPSLFKQWIQNYILYSLLQTFLLYQKLCQNSVCFEIDSWFVTYTKKNLTITNKMKCSAIPRNSQQRTLLICYISVNRSIPTIKDLQSKNNNKLPLFGSRCIGKIFLLKWTFKIGASIVHGCIL